MIKENTDEITLFLLGVITQVKTADVMVAKSIINFFACHRTYQ